MKKLKYSDDAILRFAESEEWKMLKEIIEDKIHFIEETVFSLGKEKFDKCDGSREQLKELINFIDKRTKPPQNV